MESKRKINSLPTVSIGLRLSSTVNDCKISNHSSKRYLIFFRSDYSEVNENLVGGKLLILHNSEQR